MDFFELLNERHSIRAFKNQPLEPEKMQQILNAINLAPSAGNLQAFEVYIASETQLKMALATAANDQEFLTQAPAVLIFCAHAAISADRYGKRGTELYCVQDATIACTFAMLAVTALGLSTVWVGAFNEEMVRQVICAPKAHRPVAMLPIGYPAETPRRRTRRKLSDLIHEVKSVG